MIKQQELDGRIYKGKELVGFRYLMVVSEDDGLIIEFTYRKLAPDAWMCFAFMPDSGFFGDETFRTEYTVPAGSSMAFIAAVGLNSFSQAITDRHEVESVLAMRASKASNDVIYKPFEVPNAKA